MRKQKIERVFADAKVKHGLRYTQLRGLAKVTMQVTLTFACMNLKKLAKWKRRSSSLTSFFTSFSIFFQNVFFSIHKSVHAAAKAKARTLLVYSLFGTFFQEGSKNPTPSPIN